MIPPSLLPVRNVASHKGDFGHVYCIAGSRGLSGAAALCAQAALRAGAGLVSLAVPKSLHDPMAAKLTEVMLHPLAETKQGSLSLQAFPEILDWLEQMDAIALGPGLSQNPQTAELIRRLLPRIVKPLVVDADGLNALVGEIDLLKKLTLPVILTPHPGEMGRLVNLSVSDIQRDRQRIAIELARKYRVVVVLKGAGTVVTNFDGSLYVNETGNPGMATGGCGDVLAGLIAGLLGQKLSPFDAARLGVYLHGLAADLAASQVGPVGLIASDIADRIPQAIHQYQNLPT
ncbi:MAG: NAD(P)H-hydrate dehydratase [Candidatus Omnitrophica bacterium]|nr:NAD(P)H-hydrate dehydratase [Candidatus Omnitrophota bacterium]